MARKSNQSHTLTTAQRLGSLVKSARGFSRGGQKPSYGCET